MTTKKIIAAFTAAACSLMAAPGLATDTTSEPTAMLYWQKDFGGSPRAGKEIPSYGFAVTRTAGNTQNAHSAGNPFSFLQGGRPAYLDMRFSNDGLQRLYVNGLNSLERVTVYNNAEGTTGTATQIHWGWVAAGVILGGVVLHDITKDDDCVPEVRNAFRFGVAIEDSCGNPLPPPM